jgi:hypothetical protein
MNRHGSRRNALHRLIGSSFTSKSHLSKNQPSEEVGQVTLVSALWVLIVSPERFAFADQNFQL